MNLVAPLTKAIYSFDSKELGLDVFLQLLKSFYLDLPNSFSANAKLRTKFL